MFPEMVLQNLGGFSALTWLANSWGVMGLVQVHVCSAGRQCMTSQYVQCPYPCLATIQNYEQYSSYANNLGDLGVVPVVCALDVY